LYTHKRNKHNIIPITGKPEIFKLGNSLSNLGKFKYNAFEANSNIQGNVKEIIHSFQSVCLQFYFDEKSTFFNPVYQIQNDKFLYFLNMILNSKIQKIEIPKPEDNPCIYQVLSVYLILLMEVTREKFFTDLLVKFVFLLREYLNIVGWDHKKFLSDFGLMKKFQVNDEFCSVNGCEEIPELVNNFIGVFIEMDPLFSSYSKDLTDISQNFCYWLFINGFTDYKLCKNET
jgi:hypothetical protein